MIDLIELLIGGFVTAAVYYARYFYGVRAMLELIAVFVISFVLVIVFITEIMKSAIKDEDTDDRKAYRTAYEDHAKNVKYEILLRASSALSKIVDLYTEIVDEEDEGEYLDE